MRELREGIESLMDADALVPADGGALLVLVDVAATCLRAGDLATSSHYLEALVALLTVFDARGPRGRAGDHAPIDDARALLEHCRAARRLRPVNDRPAEE